MRDRSSALRLWLAACLMLALALGGVGRGLAAASEGPDRVAGLAMPICHAGATTRPTVPAAPARHDCCDACASWAAAPSAAPGLAQPCRLVHRADHDEAPTGAPPIARVRTPRLSQGPPSA